MKAKLQLLAIIMLTTSVLSPEYAQAQRFSQEIKVSKQKAGVFLEVKQTAIPNPFLPLSIVESTVGPISTERYYWMGPNTAVILQTALRKVLSWANLNETHQKHFEKEAARIRVMRTEDFKVHGYVPQLTTEAILVFQGNSDGSFSCVLNFRNDAHEAHFESKQEVTDFISLLSGKSANKEIDDIFH